jgi:hypothetical protein
MACAVAKSKIERVAKHREDILCSEKAHSSASGGVPAMTRSSAIVGEETFAHPLKGNGRNTLSLGKTGHGDSIEWGERG